jgi:Raf kinase inhibitor-like YbhB/YbcL family protein
VKVTSTAFTQGQAIPETYSDYGRHLSPPLEWSGYPDDTRAFAVIVEDPDAKAMAPEPYVHWVLYNLPAGTHALPASVPATPQLQELGNALQGKTTRGSVGYFGPRPPGGDPPHHYHFQVFALDAPLPLAPGADKDAVVAAMEGHVLAVGDLVGTFRH